MRNLKNGIWITWELHRRNRGISAALNWPLYEIRSKRKKPLRIILSAVRTYRVLRQKKPEFLVVQNPSIILAIFTVIIRPLYRYVLIIDSHNSGIYPTEGRFRLLMVISRWLQRNADLTIITNDALKEIVESNNGRGFVLPDRIPSVPKTIKMKLPGKVNIGCIATFHEDEPYHSIIRSGSLLPGNIFIFMTGSYEGKIRKNIAPDNVKLLGYLDEDKYWSLLSSVDGIMDLTKRNNCLVCGAYEGVAVSKPLILSKTKTLMGYFDEGCIYVENNPEDIAKGIAEFVKRKNSLEKQVIILRQRLEKTWKTQLDKFKYDINNL